MLSSWPLVLFLEGKESIGRLTNTARYHICLIMMKIAQEDLRGTYIVLQGSSSPGWLHNVVQLVSLLPPLSQHSFTAAI